HWAALMMLAYCYEALGRDKDALVASQRALKKEPGDFFALQVAGRVAARLGEHETARALVTQALAVYPPPDPIPRQLSSLMRTVVNLPGLRRMFRKDAADELDPVMRQEELDRWKQWADSYLAACGFEDAISPE